MIPIDYDKIFKDRLVVITGAGRSGTTILGKLLGSMKPVFYLFEPVIMRYFPNRYYYENEFKGILFEDYFLPLVQGRRFNPHATDYSYSRHYYQLDKILLGRGEAIDYLQTVNPLYVAKIPDVGFQLIGKTIHIIRNGNEAISSAVNLGWYTDEFMKDGMLDFVTDENIPYWIDKESNRYWPIWSATTRVACIWRRNIEIHNNSFLTIRYEELKTKPIKITKQLAKIFKAEVTDKTKKHIRSIQKHTPKKYPSIVDQIQKPEQAKFAKLMGELGYEV